MQKPSQAESKNKEKKKKGNELVAGGVVVVEGGGKNWSQTCKMTDGQTVKKTDRQIHREKDNTLARKPKGSHYVGGVHCETHTYTQLISLVNSSTRKHHMNRVGGAVTGPLKTANVT